jgi:hypothetical protein
MYFRAWDLRIAEKLIQFRIKIVSEEYIHLTIYTHDIQHFSNQNQDLTQNNTLFYLPQFLISQVAYQISLFFTSLISQNNSA